MQPKLGTDKEMKIKTNEKSIDKEIHQQKTIPLFRCLSLIVDYIKNKATCFRFLCTHNNRRSS